MRFKYLTLALGTESDGFGEPGGIKLRITTGGCYLSESQELYSKLIEYKRSRDQETNAFERSAPLVKHQSELLMLRLKENLLPGMGNLIEMEERLFPTNLKIGQQRFDYFIQGKTLHMAGKRFSFVPFVECLNGWDIELNYSLEGPNLKGWVVSGSGYDWQIAQHGRDSVALKPDSLAAVLMKGLL